MTARVQAPGASVIRADTAKHVAAAIMDGITTELWELTMMRAPGNTARHAPPDYHTTRAPFIQLDTK